MQDFSSIRSELALRLQADPQAQALAGFALDDLEAAAGKLASIGEPISISFGVETREGTNVMYDFNALKSRFASEQAGDPQRAYRANVALEAIRAGIGDLQGLGYRFELIEADESAPASPQQYPKMLYRDAHEPMIVHDFEEEKSMIGAGWRTAINDRAAAVSAHLEETRTKLVERNPDMNKAEIDRRLATAAKTFQKETSLGGDQKLPEGVIRPGADGPANNLSALQPPEGEHQVLEGAKIAPEPAMTDKEVLDKRIEAGSGASRPNIPGKA